MKADLPGRRSVLARPGLISALIVICLVLGLALLRLERRAASPDSGTEAPASLPPATPVSPAPSSPAAPAPAPAAPRVVEGPAARTAPATPPAAAAEARRAPAPAPRVPETSASKPAAPRGAAILAPPPPVRRGTEPVAAAPNPASATRPAENVPEVAAPSPPRSPASPTVVVPAPAAPAAAAPAPAPIFDRESTALAQVLDQYELAYQRRDAGAAAALWPSVDVRALTRAFARLGMQDLKFGDCTFALAQNEGTARCAGVLRYSQRIGDTTPRVERHVWTIEFIRNGEVWRIARMTAQ